MPALGENALGGVELHPWIGSSRWAIAITMPDSVRPVTTSSSGGIVSGKTVSEW